MSRNYVDNNGNLIQIAGKGVGVAEWGTPIENWLVGHTSQATAITAEKDGVLFYSGSTNGALYEDNKVVFSEAQSGTNYFMYGVRKGHKYYGNPFVTSGKVYCVFFPFKENNNLQMVREKYSTEETVIGEWEDENGVMKTLYRKKVMYSITNGTSITLDMNTLMPNFNTVVRYELIGTYKQYYESNTDKLRIYRSGNNFIVYRGSENPPLPINGYLLLEYTKTTD